MKSLLLMLCILESLVLYGQVNFNPERKPANYIYRRPSDQHEINLFPDSVRLEFPEHHAVVVLEAKSFEKTLTLLETLRETLKDLAAQMNQSVIPDKRASYRVDILTTGYDQQEIKIQKRNEQTQVLVKEAKVIQLLPPGWEFFIQSKEMKGYIYIESLETLDRLAGQNFTAATDKLRDFKTFITNRRPVKARFIIRNGLLEYDDIKFEEPYDQIGLSASGGVGVIHNTIYPELNGTLSLTFADHFNRKRHRFELTYSSAYFAQRSPEGGYDNSISSFLSFSYSRNFERTNKRPSWAGLGAGVLMHETGNYFQGKTARFFLISDLGTSKLSLMPEFYLTDDLKKFQFGLKLQYRF